MRARLISTAVLAALAAPCPARAASPELLVDATSGKVLRERDANRPWHPASLTKLMTTYLALQAVASGRLSADTPVTISGKAAKAPPSRSGLPVGSRITLGDALKILMVKSANDVATAVAETVHGDVDTFVARMNVESHRLGMGATSWRNPHGLDDQGQVTTAHDMAILAMAIRRDFAGVSALFGIHSIAVQGRVMNNHNHAVGRVPDIDGMKTGYICASGFNVVTTGQRGGRLVVAVVMGGDSAVARDARASLLVQAGLSTPPGAGIADLSQFAGSNGLPAERRKCGRGRAGEEEDDLLAGVVDEWTRSFRSAPRRLDAPIVITTLPSAPLMAASVPTNEIPKEPPVQSAVKAVRETPTRPTVKERQPAPRKIAEPRQEPSRAPRRF